MPTLLPKAGRLLLPILGLLPAFPAAASPPPPLAVSVPATATVPLDGPWQFHLGDDPSWSSPTLNDSAWESISVDKPWGAQNHYAYSGFAWYRRHIVFKPVSSNPPASPSADIALFLPPVSDAYELYWNGDLIGHFGRLPPHASWQTRPSAHSFGLGHPIDGVLAIRVWSAPLSSTSPGTLGGLHGPPLAGPPAAIADHIDSLDYIFLRNRQAFFDENLLFGAAALLGLFAWSRYRSAHLILWTSLYLLAAPFAVVLTQMGLPLPYTLTFSLYQINISLGNVSLWFMLIYLFHLDEKAALMRWTRRLAFLSFAAASLDAALVAALPLLTGSDRFYAVTDGLLTIVFIGLELYPLVLILVIPRQRLSTPSLLVATFAAIVQVLIAFREIAHQGIRFTRWTFADALNTPIFTVNGNYFNAQNIASACLFLSVLYAVFRYTAGRGQRQIMLEREFHSASELQKILIPQELPFIPGFSIASVYKPALELGGDFYQVLTLMDSTSRPSALIVLGDVSGKGLKAAMTVSLIVGTLRTLVGYTHDPAEILRGLNQHLIGRTEHGFSTCIILRVASDGRAILANAGHLSPFRAGVEFSVIGSLPLGLSPDAAYENVAFRLAPGEDLTLFTDGILEARNRKGELFGFDRVAALMAAKPTVTQVVEAAVHFGQDDDITVLTLTRVPESQQHTGVLNLITQLQSPTEERMLPLGS